MFAVNAVGWILVLFFLAGGIFFYITIPEIWIGQIWIAVSLFLLLVYGLVGMRGRKLAKLRTDGIPGKAHILEMTQTGVYVNQQPQVKLRLRVEGQGVASFEVEKRVTVPMIALGSLSNGQPLTVWMERDNPREFVIDWGGSQAGGGFTISSQNGPPISVNDPAAQQAVLRVLQQNGLSTQGADLRQNPAVRAQVLETLRQYGVDVEDAVASAGAALSTPPPPPAPATPPPAPPPPLDSAGASMPAPPVAGGEASAQAAAIAAESGDTLDRLQRLMDLKGRQLITDEEFKEHKDRILKGI